MPKFLLHVHFYAHPTTIEVEAASMREAWKQRYELAADAAPESWEINPVSVEPTTNEPPVADGGERV